MVNLSLACGRAIVVGEVVGNPSRFSTRLDTRTVLPHLPPRFVAVDLNRSSFEWPGAVEDAITLQSCHRIPDPRALCPGMPPETRWLDVLLNSDTRERFARELRADLMLYGLVKSITWSGKSNSRMRPVVWELAFAEAGEAGSENRERGSRANVLLSAAGRDEFVAYSGSKRAWKNRR